MLAIASKPRGDRSSVGETKLPAALLTRPVSGPCGEDVLDHLVDRERVADVDAEGCHAAAMQVHQSAAVSSQTLLRRPQMWTSAPSSRKPLGHRLAEAGAAAGDKDASSSEELFSEHSCFHPKGLPVNWLID